MRSDTWLVLAVCSLMLWGLWGFFQKLATNYMGPKSVYIFAASSIFMVVLFTLFSLDFRPELHPKGILYSILAGLTGSVGGLFFVHSVNRGKASVVITMTALYPVVTILLSFLILKEGITLKQGFGIVLALISMVLLSG